MVYTSTDNNYGTAKLIVGTTGKANYLTIASALTAASNGDTIFILPGTYTENITLKAGVSLTAFTGDASIPNVTISGTATFTGVGTSSINNIRLQTNSNFLLAVTGSSESVVILNGCDLNCTNNTGISYTSSSANSSIKLNECRGNLGTTGIALFSMSSTGSLDSRETLITNTGASTTANTISAGTLTWNYSTINNPITSSSTGGVNFSFSVVNSSATNSTALTAGGTGSSTAEKTTFKSGTASAISVGVGATMTLQECNINTSNTNAITGSGTVSFTGLVFPSSSYINTTTQTYISTTSKTTRITGSTTWTKDVRTKSARIIGWGGGGGGGSGRARGDAVVRGGGSAGTCQGMFDLLVDSSVLGTTESVVIGSGGSGGNGVVPASDGNNGVNGGVTTFGDINTYSTAVNSRGTAGGGGDVTGGTAPYVITPITATLLPGTGGTGSASGTGGNGTDSPSSVGVGQCFWGGAGGGGGGITGGGTPSNGGRGGNLTTWAAAPSTILAGGTAGTVGGVAGGAGNNASTLTSGGVFCTGSGGGGSRGTIGTSGAGGNGGIPGGGGGGSGGGTSATDRGGNGARGEILIIEYF